MTEKKNHVDGRPHKGRKGTGPLEGHKWSGSVVGGGGRWKEDRPDGQDEAPHKQARFGTSTEAALIILPLG